MYKVLTKIEIKDGNHIILDEFVPLNKRYYKYYSGAFRQAKRHFYYLVTQFESIKQMEKELINLGFNLTDIIRTLYRFEKID